MTETYDFVDYIAPILEAGTWTNYGSSPKIVRQGKSGPSRPSPRGNKNDRVEIKNGDGGDDVTELTFEGTPMYQFLGGEITLVSTQKANRNKMKTDLLAILKAGGVTMEDPRALNNPTKRNKDKATYFFRVLKC